MIIQRIFGNYYLYFSTKRAIILWILSLIEPFVPVFIKVFLIWSTTSQYLKTTPLSPFILTTKWRTKASQDRIQIHTPKSNLLLLHNNAINNRLHPHLLPHPPLSPHHHIRRERFRCKYSYYFPTRLKLLLTYFPCWSSTSLMWISLKRSY